MWVGFLGLLTAFIGYSVFSYLAFIAAGIEIREIWEIYRLTPVYSPELAWPFYSWILWLVGVIWWLCIALISGVAISKITYEQLKGDEFYEIKEAIKFAVKNGKSTILAPFVLILFIAGLVVTGIILALITWIPYFGQLFFTLMAIPAFFVCMFIIYLAIVTVVSLLIGPAIVGATGNDTFDTLFESFSVINDQPWRFVVYQVLLYAVMVVGVGLLGFFAAKAIFLCQDVIEIIVPSEKFDNILANAAYYVKLVIPPFYPYGIQEKIVQYVDWIGMNNLLYSPSLMPAYEGWAGHVASFVLGIIYYFIILGVMSFGTAIYWAGNTVIFTVLVKKKDDKNLLEIKEEIFDEPKEEKTEEKGDEKKPKRKKKNEEEGKIEESKTEEDKKEA
jgi:hypothetical protein